MSALNGLYIITGIMASGKSTVAQLLAERFERGVHVRGDAFRRMIVSGRIEMNPSAPPEALEQLRLRYRLAASVAQACFAAGFTTVVQDNYLGEEARGFLDLFDASPLFYVTLCPSVSAVQAREAGRAKTGYATWDVAALNRVLEEENPRVGLWLDSSRLTPEQTVDQILLRAWDEARVR